jgi:hypothetical protein
MSHPRTSVLSRDERTLAQQLLELSVEEELFDPYADNTQTHTHPHTSSSHSNRHTILDSDLSSDSEDEEYQPSDIDIDHLEWSTPTTYHHPPSFTSNSGPTHRSHHNKTPLDFFNLLFPSTLYTSIANATNTYANTQHHSTPWSSTTADEVRAYIGMRIHMGIAYLSRADMYWSDQFNIPSISNIMSRDRYDNLTHMLYFSNRMDSDNPLDKIHILTDTIQHTLTQSYSPSQYLSIDECIVPFRGRTSFRQYIPNKRHRYGYKLYQLTDASTGYLLAFNIFTGKHTDTGHNDNNTEQKISSHAHTTVQQLIQPYKHKQHVLIVDNFYTSIPLFRYLHDVGIEAIGTVRNNRKLYPKQIISQLKNKHDSTVLQSDTLYASAWKDKKPVSFLSTVYDQNGIHTYIHAHTRTHSLVHICMYIIYLCHYANVCTHVCVCVCVCR